MNERRNGLFLKDEGDINEREELFYKQYGIMDLWYEMRKERNEMNNKSIRRKINV